MARYSSIAELRKVLRSYTQLRATTSDVDSAMLLFDLANALDAGVLTQRQKEAIQLLLINNTSCRIVAEQMGVKPRAVYTAVHAGLRRLLSYLRDGELPKSTSVRLWTASERNYLISHAYLSRQHLAYNLKRSVPSVYQKLNELRHDGILIAAARGGRPVSKNHGGGRAEPRVSNSHGGPA